MLRAADVSFDYRRGGGAAGRPAADRSGRRRVLDGVSVHVERGLIVGLLGPNGSGKTTLIRLLAGLLTPQRGEVFVDGLPIGGLTRRAIARRIALVPQDTHAAFDFSVLDIVLMGRYPHLGTFALEGADDVALARAALAATGTSALEHRSFSTLSGGERQRVVIASALAQASDVLLLDEPTASLDVGYQLEIAALLRRLNQARGTTMVLSTHDLNLAAGLCDRIVLLKDGRVIADGPTADTITPERIALAYDVTAEVQFHARAGHLTVTPLARCP